MPVKVDAETPEMPVMFVALSPTISPFAFIFPETVTALRVPTEVIFGCAAVLTVPVKSPLNVVAVATPVTFIC